MRKYILLGISFFFIISSVAIIISRQLIPATKNKKYQESLIVYDYQAEENAKKLEKEKAISESENTVIELEGTDSDIAKVYVGKYIQKINSNSYADAYDLLATSFKNINFKTLEEYESYMKQNYNKFYIVEYLTVERKNDIIICSVNLKEYKNANEPIPKVFSIIKENDSYKLSFGLGEKNE